MPRVVHFELPAEDPERAARFYSDVFGWSIQKWQGPQDYWLVMTGEKSEPGIDGGIMRQGDSFPAKTPINTIDVPSVDAATAKVESAGGAVMVPKMPIPGVGYLAYCKDTEGVIFGVMQFDKSAA